MTEEKKEVKKTKKEIKEKAEKEYKLSDLPGIGPGSVEKLEAAGIYDLMGVAVMTPPGLSELAGLGESVARKAIQAARNMMNLGFSDGLEFAKKREEVNSITTGSKNLDALLGGKGVETKAMTEAFGAYGSGKCVSKDTFVSYFNDSMHLQQIQEVYEKYKDKNESDFDEGTSVPLNTVKVLCFNGKNYEVLPASHIYREKVKKIFKIKTERGRLLKVTGNHKVLSFNNGINWKKVKELKIGDVIAFPEKLNILEENNELSCDDAYFLGFFVAEGTGNPFSVSNSNKQIIDWICSYIKNKFGYCPTVREDNRRENTVYSVLLRKETALFMRGLEKTNSSSKFVPESIFNSNEQIISSFLSGYLEGDGELAENILSVTTKSKNLAIQLNYLFLRLGIATTFRIRKIKGDIFYVLFVVGEDRLKINELFSFKFKKVLYSPENSRYGYPKQIISFLRKVYSETIGGNRGKHRKEIGKINSNNMAYRHLTRDGFVENLNLKTFQKIKFLFLEGQRNLDALIKLLLNEEFNIDLLGKVFDKLPFAFNSIAGKIGVKKSTIKNYNLRKIPEDRKNVLRNLLLGELLIRKNNLDKALNLMETLDNFRWDKVTDIEEVEYDDYVYDFVVPFGHSFIGGNMPTIMHNTQLGLSLAVNVQLPLDMGGANGKAVYIDTEGTFRPERVKQIAEAIGANSEKILKNIFVARAFNSDHQILLIDKIGEMIKEGEPIKVVIIDSLTAHFRAEFSGRGQLADRQQKLNRYLHNLMKIAEQYNLAVFVTNQVMANPAMMFGDPTTAIGGHIVGHACLTGDSLIQLSDGSIKEISNIKEDEVICNHNFKLSSFKSEKCLVNPDVTKVYNIFTNSQIKCSALHRFFSVENFGITEKEARYLKEGEFIMQAGKLNIEGSEQNLPVMQLKKVVKISKQSSDLVKEKLKENKGIREEICKKIGITKRHLRKVLNQQMPTSFNVAESLQDYLRQGLILQFAPVQTYKHRNLIIPEVMTPALSQVFGYFLGDGNFEARGLRFRDQREEILIYYKNLFKEIFNVDGKISKMKNKNCFTLDINSSEISDFFRLIAPAIFDYIGRSKEDVLSNFIKGFFDAEGHCNKTRAYISVTQKDEKILRYLQMFLLRLGIRSTIKFNIGKKKINVLRIIDKDVAGYLKVGFTAGDKQAILIKKIGELKEKYSYEIMPVKRKELRELLEHGGVKFSNVIKSRPEGYKWVSRKELEKAFNVMMNTKIKDKQVKQKVDFIFNLLNSDLRFECIRKIAVCENNGEMFYDFSVPGAKNYISNGFVVHNSTFRLYLRRGKKNSRVAKMIDSPNLPENETVFFITADGLRDGE